MQDSLVTTKTVRIFTNVNNDNNKQKPNYYDKIKQSTSRSKSRKKS